MKGTTVSITINVQNKAPTRTDPGGVEKRTPAIQDEFRTNLQRVRFFDSRYRRITDENEQINDGQQNTTSACGVCIFFDFRLRRADNVNREPSYQLARLTALLAGFGFFTTFDHQSKPI